MRILVKPVGLPVEVREVTDSYRGIKEGLDGALLDHITFKVMGTVLNIWIDDEGKLKGLEPQFFLPWGDTLNGPLVFTGGADEEGNTLGITPSQEAVVRLMFED